MATKKESGIKIGDKVCLRDHFIVTNIGEYHLEIELVHSKKRLYVTKYLSALGSFLPEYSWVLPMHPATLGKDYHLTGEYYIGEIKRYAKLMEKEDIDNNLLDIIEQLNAQKDKFNPSLVMGEVVCIVAEYYGAARNEKDQDLRFYENTRDAELDYYTDEVTIILRDLGSSVEYPISLNHLTKM